MGAAYLGGPQSPDSTKKVGAFYCDGKQRFDSPALAQQIVKRMRRRHREEDAAKAGIYRCPTCGGWHIGRRRHPAAQRAGGG